MAKIRETFAANKGRYGFRRIAAEPRNQGAVASHKKVRRLMAKRGLAAISRKRKYKSCFGEAGRIAKNVIAGDFKADGPNKKRATDASQFACPFGKCCLSPIIDTGSGGVVSRGLSMPPSLERTMRMLDAAFAKHKDLKGLILHSGMGWQYQHDLCRKRLEEKGDSPVHVKERQLHRQLRNGIVLRRHEERDVLRARSGMQDLRGIQEGRPEYIDYHNSRRIEPKTKWMPPAKYRAASTLMN